MPGRLLLIVALAGLAAACATSAGMERPTPVVIDHRWLGFATCHHSPVAWVRADVLLTPEGRQALAHELDHLALMRGFASCDAFNRWKASHPAHPVMIEARAFCASSRADASTGRMTLDAAIKKHSYRLAHGYGFGMTRPQAERAIRYFCTPRPAP